MNIIAIKSPQQIKIAQQNYIREAEERALQSLIVQFNETIVKTKPNKDGSYTLNLYLARPAGVTDVSNVERRFILHCLASGWDVSKLSYVSECRFLITVKPSF